MNDAVLDPAAVSGFDLSFRPSSYFWPLRLATHLLARIKGAERRAALQQLVGAGRVDEIPEFLARSALTESERQAIGRLHPAFMGGEYLPDFADNEVEVARITIASTTQDVTSVFARRGKARIRYRVVDEYGGDTLSGKAARTSTRPLTLGELTDFFIGAWPLLDVLDMNFGREIGALGRMQAFIIGADSEFYPQFGALIRARVSAWAAGA